MNAPLPIRIIKILLQALHFLVPLKEIVNDLHFPEQRQVGIPRKNAFGRLQGLFRTLDHAHKLGENIRGICQGGRKRTISELRHRVKRLK